VADSGRPVSWRDAVHWTDWVVDNDAGEATRRATATDDAGAAMTAVDDDPVDAWRMRNICGGQRWS
jgi:hypothetical protein